MAKFQETRGRANRALFVQNFSKLAPVSSSLVPHPEGSAMQVFEFAPSSSSQATRVVAWELMKPITTFGSRSKQIGS